MLLRIGCTRASQMYAGNWYSRLSSIARICAYLADSGPRNVYAVTMNGPTGDSGSPSTGYDTVIASVVRAGGYQWPNCYGYGHLLAPATSCGKGQIGPDWSSEEATVVPTGATFVDASGPSAMAGHLVFCTFAGPMAVLTHGSPHAAVTNGPDGCGLDVKQGPDHALYYSDRTRIYRLG